MSTPNPSPWQPVRIALNHLLDAKDRIPAADLKDAANVLLDSSTLPGMCENCFENPATITVHDRVSTFGMCAACDGAAEADRQRDPAAARRKGELLDLLMREGDR